MAIMCSNCKQEEASYFMYTGRGDGHKLHFCYCCAAAFEMGQSDTDAILRPIRNTSDG